jgi:BirA family biotin operon repressor/biotin-[acetyl-CoA-carboxylase] ligase
VKTKILKKLTSADVPIPKKQLIEELNISEILLRNNIQELQEAGYTISETAEEFTLTNEPDVLFPWEFEKRESKIHFFNEIDSTMNMARKMAKDHSPHFTVIIAERQTKGRGRLKRTWISEKGGLYITIILRPNLSISQAHTVNFAASLSLAKVFHDHFNLNGDKISFINIGIGINVNNDPTMDEPNATSLKKLLKRNIFRKTILSLFLDEFENTLNQQDMNKILSQWKAYTMTIGRYVRVVTNKETIEGTAMDVDKNGALIVKLNDGTVKPIIYGDCFVG